MKAQHPFTVAWVRETIEALGDRYSVPSESTLFSLANRLNLTTDVYESREVTRAHLDQYTEMYNALQVQKRWFDDRWKELEAANLLHDERETQLRDKFNAYMEAMTSHHESNFLTGLPMEVWRVWPILKNWRDIAEYIADAFVLAMKESNPGRTFGFSDDGPAVKFTLAALERIGAAPRAGSPENARYRIAQRIRELKAKKKRKEKPDL